MQAPRDENFVPAMLFVGSDGETYPVEGDETTGRIFVDLAGGSGTVTSVSVVSANGFAGSVATATTTPAITLSTTITGILKGNGTAISAVTIGSGLSFDGTTLSATGSGSPGGSDTQVQYNNAGAFGGITGATTNGTVVTLTSALATTAFSPSSNDGAALGSGTASWSDLFLASGSVINWDNGDALLTHGTNTLALTGAMLGIGGTPTEILHLIKPTTEFTTMQFDSGTTQGYMFAYDGDNSVNIGSKSNATVNFKVNNTSEVTLTSSAMSPATSDGNALGTSSLMWSDLFLADGGVINWNAGNISLTHSAGVLTISDQNPGATGPTLEIYQDSVSPAANDVTGTLAFYGEDSAGNKQLYSSVKSLSASVTSTTEAGVLIFSTVSSGTVAERVEIGGTSIRPSTNDGFALGNTALQWSDLFLAEGGVINWDNGDVTLTQTGNVLAVAGGDLRVATADVGTNADSVPTLSSTSTLTNKTLTSPTINTATIGGATLLAENASIDLDPSLSADGTYSGICITGTAGTTLAFGDLIYLAVADSRWELVDADSVTTCGAVLTGMCVLAAAADGNATKILLKGNIRADAAFPALTVGANVYAGLTAGDIVTTAPSATDDVVHVVGKALTADSIYFDPSEDYITIV